MSVKVIGNLKESIAPTVTSESDITILHQLIEAEIEAVDAYTKAIEDKDFSQEVKDVLSEILNDEKDHLVILTNTFKDIVGKDYPDNQQPN